MADVSTPISFDGHPLQSRVLTEAALGFVAELERRFGARRAELLALREERQRRFDAGELPGFLPETGTVRSAAWLVAEAPKALMDRRVEIAGPTDRKMMIDALNSGACVFVADIEDATSPTWGNIVSGQVNLQDAVRRRIRMITPERTYRLNEEIATLVVRPRGWHLDERHMRVAGRPVSASLFDFGLHAFHNATEAVAQGFGPYFCLPKLESHLEARLWHDAIVFAEEALGLDRGTIRVTVLIETVLAAFEMDEILYELRDHVCGLNAGRWDYIFSIVKTLRSRPDFVLPDRAAVTMTVPFMRACTDLLVTTCHRRGAHAIGGMSAFVPNQRRPEATERALAAVADDKRREALDGFDGTWVAHPDLVATALAELDAVLGTRPNQLDRAGGAVPEGEARIAAELLAVRCPPGAVTAEGLRRNVSVGIRYLASWLSGVGAVAIDDLMEDAATAEICRAQLWQWARHGVVLEDGRAVTAGLVGSVLADEAARIAADPAWANSQLAAARGLFAELALGERFVEFLTLPAYELL